MATTTLTLSYSVDSTQVTDIINTISDYLGYSTTITNPDGTTSPNPMSRSEFIREYVGTYLKNCYTQQKTTQAVISAQASAGTSASTVTIT